MEWMDFCIILESATKTRQTIVRWICWKLFNDPWKQEELVNKNSRLLKWTKTEMKFILFWSFFIHCVKREKKIGVATHAQKMYVIFPYHDKITFLEKEVEKITKKGWHTRSLNSCFGICIHIYFVQEMYMRVVTSQPARELIATQRLQIELSHTERRRVLDRNVWALLGLRTVVSLNKRKIFLW